MLIFKRDLKRISRELLNRGLFLNERDALFLKTQVLILVRLKERPTLLQSVKQGHVFGLGLVFLVEVFDFSLEETSHQILVSLLQLVVLKAIEELFNFSKHH